MRFALKYGVKYGPHVLVAAKALKEPATAYAQKLITAQQSLKAARAQAATLQAGTVLQAVSYTHLDVYKRQAQGIRRKRRQPGSSSNGHCARSVCRGPPCAGPPGVGPSLSLIHI